MNINKSDVILGEFEVTAPLTTDAVFQWVHARSQREDQQVLLQILRSQTSWSKESLAIWVDYFDALGGVSRKSLHLPTQVLSDSRYPLVMVYPPLSGNVLEDALKAEPAKGADFWHQASEAINILHNRGLVHGGIRPQCFIAAGNAISLTGFGYGPLVQIDFQLAREVLKDFLAPEEPTDRRLTKAADIYAFAQTVAHWRPDLMSTSWYQQATSPEPSHRFRNMRDVASGLEKVLTPASNASATSGEVPVITGRAHLVPKFTVTCTSEPAEGGKIQGSGNYRSGDAATVTAIPALGWRFDVWSEDVRGDQNPAEFVIDANKSVIAHFTRVRQTEFTLRTSSEPAKGGEVIGGGRYFEGIQATVEVKAAIGWTFIGWRGDLSGKTEQSILTINSDKSIVAVFHKVPDPIFSVSSDPSEGGSVLGGGSHALNTEVTLRAVAAPLWRFLKWSGAVSGAKNPVKVPASSDGTFVAHFVRTIWEEVDLAVTIIPAQGGTIVGVSNGSGKHKKGQPVQVFAKPNRGWRFQGWTGDAQGVEPAIALEMDSSTVITAHFQPEKFQPEKLPHPLSGGAFKTQSEETGLPAVEESKQQGSGARTAIPLWASSETEKMNRDPTGEQLETSVLTPPPTVSSLPPAAQPSTMTSPPEMEDAKAPKRRLGNAFLPKQN